MDENFWGGREFQRGCVHRHPLIFFFWGVRQKFLGGGVFVSALWSFFLRGSNFIDLVHRGVCTILWQARSPKNVHFVTSYSKLIAIHNEIYLRDVIRCPRKGGNFQQLHQIFTICSRYNLVSMPVRGLCSGNSSTQLVLSFLRSVSDAVTARGLLLSNIPRPIFSLCPH